MKLVPDATGRFVKRPHYTPGELDTECELLVSSFLRERHGNAAYPITTDDLTVFIEKEAQDLDLFADLSEFGTGVEGVTIFNPGAKPIVKINRELSEDPSRKNRLRTTLTHEFGHVHFHAYLFDDKLRTLDLYKSQQGKKDIVQVCKRETMLDARQTDWMEWQAGHVCGAILMPGSTVRRFVKDTVASLGDTSLPNLEQHVVAAVMKHFEVSEDAARVRMSRLGLLRGAQPTQGLFQ